MSTPNKERLRLWVADLRSGKFSQTRHTLKDDAGYCCLGVACETHARESGTRGRWAMRKDEETDGMSLHYVVQGEANAGVLPAPVAIWFGVSDNPMLIMGGDQSQPCGYLNDAMEWTFGQIADAVERTFKLAAP